MIRTLLTGFALLTGAPAIAQDAPEPPAPPAPVSVEACGEGCTKTVRKTRTVELGPAGEEVIREEVEVIELREGGETEVEVEVEEDVTAADGTPAVRKKVRILRMDDGQLTGEMRAEIDEMIAGIDTEDFMASGDGVFISGADGTGPARIILRHKDSEVISGASGNIEQTVGEDGARTIRITPEEGGETTIITIKTEKSSKNDN